jgi:arginase family enzyme
MPLRMMLDGGAIDSGDVALVGARSLDPGEVEFIERAGVHTGAHAVSRALDGVDAVYVALDADSVEPGELDVFMPEPHGLGLAELEELLCGIAATTRVAGAGLSGLVRTAANEPKLARLCSALDL